MLNSIQLVCQRTNTVPNGECIRLIGILHSVRQQLRTRNTLGVNSGMHGPFYLNDRKPTLGLVAQTYVDVLFRPDVKRCFRQIISTLLFDNEPAEYMVNQIVKKTMKCVKILRTANYMF